MKKSIDFLRERTDDQDYMFDLIEHKILPFLYTNYLFGYNSNVDTLQYAKKRSVECEYPNWTDAEESGIDHFSREFNEKYGIICPPDLFSGLLFCIKSGLRSKEQGYFD